MKKGGTLCARCSQPLVTARPDLCPFCMSVQSVDRLISLSYFNSTMKELLVLFKKGKHPGLRFFFAALLYDALKAEGLENSTIVPVPPRKGKLRRQGWDQVDLLCRTLSKHFGVHTARVLERRDRLQQKTLNHEERLKHMKGTLRFKRNRQLPGGVESVVILDDIYTSGATIQGAAHILKQHYKGKLTALVLCSVV